MNEKEFILALVEKFGNAKIAELDLQEGNMHITLRREAGANSGAGAVAVTTASAAHIETPSGKTVHLGIPAAGTGAGADGGDIIKSPIVGTFYASPAPDSPAYAPPGAKIKAGQPLCILEAMKMMNNFEAEFDCEIVKVHVSSGDFVEYDQILFTVKRV